MVEKICFKCNKSQPIDEFYKHSGMRDGHVGKCKTCNKKDVRVNYAGKREQYSEYDQKREKEPNRKKYKAKSLKKYRAKNPEKNKARQRVAYAVRKGYLIKQPCKKCGDEKVQAHHHDYSKPLEVDWLCFKCHREEEHGQVVTISV